GPSVNVRSCPTPRSSDLGFGMKGGPYPELVLVLWAARRIGRPVKWIGERGESFLADHQARDNVSDVELALDEHGKFLALRVATRSEEHTSELSHQIISYA